MSKDKYELNLSQVKEVTWHDTEKNCTIIKWDRENGLTYPTPIKNVTIYEGIGLLEITDDFKPKGLIEKFDYWCYNEVQRNSLNEIHILIRRKQ